MCVKLLFDQNLSFRLVARLKNEYPGSVHIGALGLDRASDFEVWNYAKANSFTIVTKDSDFNDICTLYGFPPHIIWLRLGNSRIAEAEQALCMHKKTIFKIITENKTGIVEVTAKL